MTSSPFFSGDSAHSVALSAIETKNNPVFLISILCFTDYSFLYYANIRIFVYIRTIMTEHKYDFSMIVDKSRTDFIKIKKGQTPLSHKRRMPPPLYLTSLSKDYGEETTSNKLFTVYTQFLELSLIWLTNLRISA